MKSIQMISRNIGLLLLGSMLWISCSKDTGDYNYVNRTINFPGTTYDYLKSKKGIYDSLLLVIDRLKLTDTLKNNKITLFAVTNQSFEQVVSKLNTTRKLRGKPPVYLNDIAIELLDSMVCRYIVRGNYTADSLIQTDGKMLKAVRYAYPMNGKLATANASGYKGGGPAVINYYFTKKSNFTKDWVLATADAINVRTANGIVHVLEQTHPFGFGQYTQPQSEPFDKSVFRPAGYSGPFVFPTKAGETIVIEAEDCDMGGEGISYFANAAHVKVNYRLLELINIDGTFGSQGQIFTDEAGNYPASYSLGATKAGGWLKFSVYVPTEGDYTIITRAGNGNTVGPLYFHIEFDFKNVTGPLLVKNNLGWTTWQLIYSPVFHLTAGNHSMRQFNDANDIQLNNFVIKRVN